MFDLSAEAWLLQTFEMALKPYLIFRRMGVRSKAMEIFHLLKMNFAKQVKKNGIKR